MEINDIHKYCHVSTFISYGNSTPVYKQTFKFKVSPNTHHSLLLDKNIPIKINGAEITASVQDISPFLMGYRVHLSLGSYPIKEYIYFLKEFYDEFQKYEIEIVDGLDFKAAKYFDIRNNSWKLDELVPSVLKANKLCKEFSHKKLW